MKLTRRQEEFISNLIDLSDEFDGPIHYSLLAERLGVSPFTAYDMLCLLEEKGLVNSEYQLAESKSGPGRAERLFFPNPIILNHEKGLSEKFGGKFPSKQELKQIVLNGGEIEPIWNIEIADELLARIPDIDPGELSFCVEIMTIIALRLKPSFGRKILLDHLATLLPVKDAAREDLALFGGFALGILVQENVADHDWCQHLFGYVQQYLNIVFTLNPQECQQLAQVLTDVFIRFSEEKYD
jgi:hypothetical protein